VKGDLGDLCRSPGSAAPSREGITAFKSVGTALEDLAAAMLVWRTVNARA
jgi:ornithine cyclodeaminase